MTRPRLLDLFCGAGGAGMGYHLAGFEVVGVDIAPQPDYPFAFHQADALTFPLDGFAAVHASPPCQAFTTLRVMHNAREHGDLLTPTRERLRAWGGPWVIENVPRSPMPAAIMLCGSAFGLGVVVDDGWRQVRRHRWFEASFPFLAPPCRHRGKTIGFYGDHARLGRRSREGGDITDRRKVAYGRAALGVPWMGWAGITQAIPPAFTEYIGRHLLAAVERAA